MEILVEVAGQRLRAHMRTKQLVAGNKEFVRFVINFDEGWDGLIVFAQFMQNGIYYNHYLDEDNSVYLPAEMSAGVCTMTLCGISDNVIATTGYLTLAIDENVLVTGIQSN